MLIDMLRPIRQTSKKPIFMDICAGAVQVAARLAAAGHNRALWPPAAQQEVAGLEQQLEYMQVIEQRPYTYTYTPVNLCAMHTMHTSDHSRGGCDVRGTELLWVATREMPCHVI